MSPPCTAMPFIAAAMPMFAHPVMDVAPGEIAAGARPSGPWPWCCWRGSDRPSRRPARAPPGSACRAPCPTPGASRSSHSPRRNSSQILARAASRPAGSSARWRRRNSARRSAATDCEPRFPGAAHGLAARAPPRRHPRAHLGDRRRADRSSRAARARRRSRPRRAARRAPPPLPALLGAPKAIVVRQAIRFGRSLFWARRMASAIASRDHGRRSRSAAQPCRPEARELVVGDRELGRRRRSRSSCRPRSTISLLRPR